MAKVRERGGDWGGSGLAETDRFRLKQKHQPYAPGRTDRQHPRRADYGLS
jgi:hypothetical protein